MEAPETLEFSRKDEGDGWRMVTVQLQSGTEGVKAWISAKETRVIKTDCI
jgi:hypothetical protein